MNEKTKITYSNENGKIEFGWPPNGRFWFTELNGLQSDIELTTTQSVGQLGSTVNGQSVSPKKITFNGAMHGVKSGDVESERRELLAVIVPTKKSRMEFQTGSERWYLDGYATKTPVVSDGDIVQKFQFDFYAPYPYFRTAETKSYQLSGLIALWKTPFYTGGTFWVSKFTGYDYTRVENIGNVDQAIKLNILAVADVVNPAVYNLVDETYIKIDKTMAEGEAFYISTHYEDKDDGKSVIYVDADGNEQNGFKHITPDSNLSMSVPPGGGIFMVTADEFRENIRCVLTTQRGECHSI